MVGHYATRLLSVGPEVVQAALLGQPAKLDWLGRRWSLIFGEGGRLTLYIPWRLKCDLRGTIAPSGDIHINEMLEEANKWLADHTITDFNLGSRSGDVRIDIGGLEFEAFNTASLGSAGDPWRLTFSKTGQSYSASWNRIGRIDIRALDTPNRADVERKYRAFISYSHSDLEFARRLQSWLESFSIGGGAANPLKPIYRDEGTLTAGSLTTAITSALEESDALIVVCSDAAAKSDWVAREVEHFWRVRPDGACLAIYSPNARHGTPLPQALAGTGEEEPYVPSPADEGDLLAFLRLVAGLLSLPLDEVQRYNAQNNNARRKRYQQIADARKTTQDQLGWYDRRMSEVLKGHAAQNGFSDYQFDEALTDAVGVVGDLAWALSGDSREPIGNFWSLNIQNRRLREQRPPPINRVRLDEAVMRYLGLPIREEQFERLLVEILVCTEMFGLRDFMARPHMAWHLTEAERKAYARALKSPWLGTFRDYSLPFLYFGTVLGGVELIAASGWIGDVARDIMRYVIAVIAVGYGVLAVIAVPAVITANRLVRKSSDACMDAIEKVVQVLRGDVVSMADLRKAIARAEAAEVVWPASLAPLLDDISSRSLVLWTSPR